MENSIRVIYGNLSCLFISKTSLFLYLKFLKKFCVLHSLIKAKYVFLTIAILTSCFVSAQDSRNAGRDTIPNPKDTTATRGPVVMPSQIIPASPKVSSMTKYGDYPVSLYTGLVDITVPIYTIRVNNIEVPIEFKYHASGIKYDDVSLEVGLGWSLMAGGAIDYNIRGSQDSKTNIYPFIKNENSINQNGNCYNEHIEELIGIINGNIPSSSASYKRDGESDIYSYSFLQYNGQFCIPYPDTGPSLGSFGAIFVPENRLRLTNNNPVTVLDDKGITYAFEIVEPYTDYSIRWAYYLTKIISADKSDTVLFNYTSYAPIPNNAIDRPYIDKTITLTEKNPVFLPYYGSIVTSEISHSGGYTVQSFYPPRLNSITFRGGKVDFEYYNNVAISRDLRTIKVYNNLSSSPLQIISLIKNNFSGNRGNRLDQVVFQNQQGNSYNYQFYYNGDPGVNPSGIDYWGYYNGQWVSNYNFIPNFTVERTGYVGGYQLSTLDRSANEFFMQKGILNKIVYPTKGYTEFTYEAHKAWNMTYGGLRIKEIYNYNSDGILAEKKWYRYGSNESGQGRAAAYPKTDDFIIKSRILEQYKDYYVNNCLGQVLINRLFISFPKQNYFISGSSVVYKYVTEYTGNETTDIGKTIYEFEDFPDETLYITTTARTGAADMPVRTYHWKNGMLKSREVYKKESNVYTKIYSLSNNYKDINAKEYMNLRVLPFISLTLFNNSQGYSVGDESILRCYDIPSNSDYRSRFDGNTPFDYFNYFTTTGSHVLESSIETIDGISKQVYYDTYNYNGLPTSVRNLLNSGRTLLTTYKYPQDMSGSTVYSTMANRNILTPVIETKEFVDNIQTAFHRTQYGMSHPANANLIAPVSEDYQSGSQNPLETRIAYNRYDSKGNPVHIVKDNAEQVVYLWGYNHKHPIAEIKGASYSDVTAKIAETTLNAIAAKNEPTSTDLSTIDNLRTQLPNALITTYTYRPLIGMLTMKDPREVVTQYEYDSFGRLITVTHAGKVIETYTYNIKN